MELVSSTIKLLNNIKTNQAIASGIGAFLGAFFAFCFFILGEKYKRWVEKKIEWKKIYKKEHAYLERYFYELKYAMEDNKRILEVVINSYQNNKIEFSKISDLPIREDSSMKIKDKLFMNKLETYINNGLKRINRLQVGIGQTQDRINNDILENDPIKIKRAKNCLPEFISGIKQAIKYYEYYLEVVEELIIENKYLLKKYKKWKFNNKEMEKIYSERKKAIEAHKKLHETEKFNPLLQEQKERLKKFGLYDEKQ